MAQLTLQLFGSTIVCLDDQEVPGFRTNKVLALLVYLVIEPQAHSRESLMELLWPGMPEHSARHNLRQILYHLRNAFPELNAGDKTVDAVLANRQSIQLNPAGQVEVDVHHFEALIESTQRHDHIELLLCPQCRTDLEQAVELYRGDFLANFYLDDSNEYENWSQARRQAYRRQVLDALEILTAMQIRRAEYTPASEYAERQLSIDNLREGAYRQLMEIQALSGRREEALATYEKAKRILAEDLGMAPSKRTTELYEQILAGDLSFDTTAARGVRGYELKDEIGEGAYGTIHLAIQPSVGREVAVKVIRRKLANDPEFIRRFEAEAQTIAMLEHPFIVPLYDYWRDPDGAYLVMRYMRGGSLLSALTSGPWAPELATGMVDQVASALDAAHGRGIIHRDIKPANILLDGAGNAFLSDFGIAKDLGRQGLTVEGAVIGTPDYISPEQILAEEVTPQSDIYSLGAVLYETLTGEKPFPDSSVANLIYKHLNEPIPLVGNSRPDLPPAIDKVIQRATAKRPADRYASALEMAEAYRRAVQGDVAALVPARPSIKPEVAEIYNPYKGLRAFQEADADDFFGREALVQQLIRRLDPDKTTSDRFLAVVGPSGSGKSSAIKAGLIPALRAGAIDGSDKWFVADMVPGTHPLEELELALWPVAVDPPPSLVEPMQRDSRGLLRTIRRILPDEPDAQLLLIIDQFEELFTLVEDEERRDFFIDSLLQAIAAPRSPLRVIITLRADFYDRPLQYETLGRLIKDNTEIVLPLTTEELTWSIREPARRVGVGLERGLSEAIIGDVTDQPGALPLLQYALTELFEKRQDGQLTRAAYAEIGGVLGALGRRADEIFGGLNAAGQEATRQLFLRLVTLGEGAEDTRRRVLRTELESLQTSEVSETSEVFAGVIDLFGQARLLTFDHDPVTRRPTVEVAHEALLREWGQLRRWLDRSRDDVRLQRMLARAAAEWQASDEDDSYLLRGARLAQFEGWAEGSNLALSGAEQRFLVSSVAAREMRQAEEEARLQRELETAQQLAETERVRAEEQARSARSLRRRAAFLAGALVVSGLLAAAAVFFAQQSNQNANLAATREAEALVQADQRATAQAQAELENARADEQRDVALASEERANTQANLAATAEAEAVREREAAEEQRVAAEAQAALATSRELAAASLTSLDTDPELSILLAMQAMSVQRTGEAEEALHQAVQSSRVRQVLDSNGEVSTAWLAISPHGERIYTSGRGGGAMWDLATGDVLYATPPERFSDYLPDDITVFWINRADFSPDGSLLALPLEVWEGDVGTGYIALLDPQIGEELLVFQTGGGPIQDLTFSRDGALLTSAGLTEGQTTIWDVALTISTGVGQKKATLCCHGHDGWIYMANFSPDDTRVVTTAEDGTLRVWDVASATELFAVIDSDPIEAVYSRDGRYLIAAENRAMLIYDAQSGALNASAPNTGIFSTMIEFSPDGTQLAEANRDGNVRVWSYADGELAPEPLILSGHKSGTTSVSFLPDGRYLASGSIDGTTRVWDVSANGASERGAYAHDGRTYDAAFSPDGRWLVSTSLDGTARIWDVEERRVRHVLREHGDYVLGVDIHPDGHTLATAGNDGAVRFWDAETGEQLMVIEAHETTADFVGGAKGIAFSPDGDRLASGGADGALRVWDTSSGEMLKEAMPDPDSPIHAVDYSPDGRWLISAGDHRTIKVWNPEDLQEVTTLTGDGNVIWEARFSPDSSRLISGHQYGVAHIWSFPGPEAGPEALPELLYTLPHNSADLGRGDFSPDGKLLAIASPVKTTLHDADSGELLIDLGHPATTIVFSPDGRTVATAGNDGIVRLMTVYPEDLLALAQSRVTRSLTEEECQQYLHLEACPDEH